jgi:hypothetical protein
MFKKVLFVVMLPLLAETHAREPSQNLNALNFFTATGRICAGPSIDENGDLVTSRRYYAEKLADQAASRQCYPFQYKRESAYQYRNANEDCQSINPYAIRETVTAEYSCASL